MIKKRMERLSRNSFFYFFPLFILPFFEPNIIRSFDNLELIHILVLSLQCVAFFVAFSLFVIKKGKTFSISSFILFIFSVYIIILTIEKEGDVSHALFYTLELFTITTFCRYYIEYKKRYNSVIFTFYIYFSIIVVLNLISMFLDLNTIDYKNWVFGFKNNHIYYLLPYLFFAACRNTKKNSWKKMIFPFTISLITVLLGKSTTSLFSFVLISIFTVLYYTDKLVNKYILIYFFVISITISFLFIVTKNIVYLDAVVAYYDKEATFGRFEIWEKTMNILSDSPIFGVGLESEDTMIKIVGFTHCHNKYLDITYISGFIGLFLFLLFIFCACKDINKYDNKNSILGSIILCAYAVEFMMEGKRADMGFYLVFFLLPYSLRYYSIYKKRVVITNPIRLANCSFKKLK